MGWLPILYSCPRSAEAKITSAGGFSLPGVLVGVALVGISATIISQTVINSRRTQKNVELKLSSNKFQQAALEALSERIKDFVLEKCSGARWGGSGLEVEKAFREIPLTADSDETGNVVKTKLRFTTSANIVGGTAVNCADPKGPAPLNAGEFMRFCMEITPTGSRQIDSRLIELLVVPVNLATDQALKCSEARGAAAGIKVTWQMYNQVVNNKVSGGVRDNLKTILRESGVFLISTETESYEGTCSITATRQPGTNQCTINVSGLGRRPPTILKNNVPLAGVSWTRAQSSNYDAFTTVATCEKNQVSNFSAQSAAGSDSCEAIPVQPELNTCNLSNKRVGVQGDLACSWQWCNTWRDATLSKGIVLPSDATNIQLTASDVHVDDWSPYISINGNWLVKRDEANLSPRSFPVNKDISAWVKPGINVVYVGAWNKHTFWTTFFIVSGSYKTTGRCDHEFRYYDGTSWVSQSH